MRVRAAKRGIILLPIALFGTALAQANWTRRLAAKLPASGQKGHRGAERPVGKSRTIAPWPATASVMNRAIPCGDSGERAVATDGVNHATVKRDPMRKGLPGR